MKWARDLEKAFQKHVAGVKTQKQASVPASLPSTDEQSARPALSALFPDVTPDGANIAYEYAAPPPGEESMRTPQQCQFRLQDHATREQYRQWRISVATYLTGCAQLKIMESAVRTSGIASLAAGLQANMTAYFGVGLSKVKIKELMHHLDQKHQLLSDNEDRRTIRAFREFRRTTSRSLKKRKKQAGPFRLS